MQNFNEIINKITEQITIKSDSDLAKKLGVTPQMFSRWKKNGIIPYEKLIEFAEKQDLSLDYLFFGKGEIKDITDEFSKIDMDFYFLTQYCLNRNDSFKNINKILFGQYVALAYNLSTDGTNELNRERLMKIVTALMNRTSIEDQTNPNLENLKQYEKILSDAEVAERYPTVMDKAIKKANDFITGSTTAKELSKTTINQKVKGDNNQVSGGNITNDK